MLIFYQGLARFPFFNSVPLWRKEFQKYPFVLKNLNNTCYIKLFYFKLFKKKRVGHNRCEFFFSYYIIV